MPTPNQTGSAAYPRLLKLLQDIAARGPLVNPCGYEETDECAWCYESIDRQEHTPDCPWPRLLKEIGQ